MRGKGAKNVEGRGGGGGEANKKRDRKEKKKGRRDKKKREGRREGRRIGDLKHLMSIGPSNRGRSISNFDITFYSTPETTGWSPIEISMVGLCFGDFEIGFNIGKFKVRVRFHFF